MVIYVDRVINMPIHYTFNILSGKHRTEHRTIYIALDIMLKVPLEIFTSTTAGLFIVHSVN